MPDYPADDPVGRMLIKAERSMCGAGTISARQGKVYITVEMPKDVSLETMVRHANLALKANGLYVKHHELDSTDLVCEVAEIAPERLIEDRKRYQPPHKDNSIKAVAERIEKLIAAPPLRLAVSGGGLPQEHSISPEYMVLVERGELEAILDLLKQPIVITYPYGNARELDNARELARHLIESGNTDYVTVFPSEGSMDINKGTCWRCAQELVPAGKNIPGGNIGRTDVFTRREGTLDEKEGSGFSVIGEPTKPIDEAVFDANWSAPAGNIRESMARLWDQIIADAQRSSAIPNELYGYPVTVTDGPGEENKVTYFGIIIRGARDMSYYQLREKMIEVSLDPNAPIGADWCGGDPSRELPPDCYFTQPPQHEALTMREDGMLIGRLFFPKTGRRATKTDVRTATIPGEDVRGKTCVQVRERLAKEGFDLDKLIGYRWENEACIMTQPPENPNTACIIKENGWVMRDGTFYPEVRGDEADKPHEVAR